MALHSCRNGVVIQFLQEWNDSIPFQPEWNDHSIPAGIKSLSRLCEECDTDDMDAMFTFKTRIFDLIMKVEENYEDDKFNYQNAIEAFIKQE